MFGETLVHVSHLEDRWLALARGLEVEVESHLAALAELGVGTLLGGGRRLGLEGLLVLSPVWLLLHSSTESCLLVKELVLDPRRLVEELFLAKSARVSFPVLLGNVGLSMLLEVGRRSESLSTFIALEGLFTSMDLLVPFEVRYLCEGLVAAVMSALVGLLSGVDPQVLLEGRILSERLATSDRRTHHDVVGGTI